MFLQFMCAITLVLYGVGGTIVMWNIWRGDGDLLALILMFCMMYLPPHGIYHLIRYWREKRAAKRE